MEAALQAANTKLEQSGALAKSEEVVVSDRTAELEAELAAANSKVADLEAFKLEADNTRLAEIQALEKEKVSSLGSLKSFW